MQKLRNVVRDCNFKAVSGKQNEEDAIRDAFISGQISNPIRQRLLEKKTLDVSTAYDQAKALDLAQQQSQTFATLSIYAAAARNLDQTPKTPLAASRTSCFFCGYDRHPRHKCPAKDATCKSRGKRGHFEKVCRAPANSKHTAATSPFLVSSISAAAAPASLNKAVTDVTVNGLALKALVDTGSSESYVSEEIVIRNKWSTLTFNSDRGGHWEEWSGLMVPNRDALVALDFANVPTNARSVNMDTQEAKLENALQSTNTVLRLHNLFITPWESDCQFEIPVTGNLALLGGLINETKEAITLTGGLTPRIPLRRDQQYELDFRMVTNSQSPNAQLCVRIFNTTISNGQLDKSTPEYQRLSISVPFAQERQMNFGVQSTGLERKFLSVLNGLLHPFHGISGDIDR
ncbi:unnamed protein product [Echinostoma caproni]|uniref:Peptidase A2 domain-containing protein n=1 Tax=Echinostoma caproni TaxID=27848 RepID=A0A183AA65_9TREM|nr:unnamed protein product [Echinostoma caproni]